MRNDKSLRLQDRNVWKFVYGMFFVIMVIVIIPCKASAVQNEAKPKSGNDVYQLGAITVTAQKQEENLQDVPLSVTAFDETTVEDYDMTDLWRLTDFVPNMLLLDVGMSSLFPQPTMRGISPPATTLASPVGLYVDGVPLLSGPGFQANLLDVERVEVLRGPQGTLYGKNTEVGAISVVTRPPDNTVRGKVGVRGGEDNRARVRGMLSGPILQDRFYYSVAGFYDRKDGFVDNTYLGGHDDDLQKWYGRGQIRWTPTDDLDLSFFAARTTSDERGSSMTGSDSFYRMMGMDVPPRAEVSSDERPKRRTTNDVQALTVKWNATRHIALTSISARTETDWYAKADYDFSPRPIMLTYQDSKYTRLSQEFRFNVDYEPVKALLGVYADSDQNDIHFGDGFTDTDTTDRDIDGDSYAVFGQVDYALTDALSLIGGLRYEVQNQRFTDHLNDHSDSFSAEEISPKIALRYAFTPNISVYASVSKGYRTGGFNLTATEPEYADFESEHLWSYEAGIKSTFFGERLLVNTSIYFMDIDNMQVEEWVSPITSLTTNAAKATSQGFEVEVQALVAQGLSLLGSFGYNDTTFQSFEDAKGDYSGNKNPFAPDYTYSLGARYRHDSGVYARADVVGYGPMYMDKANKNKKSAYDIVNAKVGYEWEDFDVYVYASNLFDTTYDSEEYYGYYNILSEPREVGLEVVYRF